MELDKKHRKKIENCIRNPAIVCDAITSHLEAGFSALSSHLKKESITQTSRPKNIGPGAYKKALTSQSKQVSTASKIARNVGKALGIASVAIDAFNGIQQNYIAQSSVKKYVSDLVVDVAISGSSLWAAGAIGTKVGAMAGSVFPGAGNAVGAVAGFTAGVVIYLAVDEIAYNGKTGREWAKGLVS